MSQKEVYLTNVDEKHLRWMAEEDPYWLFRRKPHAVAVYNPDWACMFVPNWMADNYPAMMFEKNKLWLVFKRPDIAYLFDAELVVNNNPYWLVTENKTVCAYLYPNLLSRYSKYDIDDIRPDLKGGKHISKLNALINIIKNMFGGGNRNDRLPAHLAEMNAKPYIKKINNEMIMGIDNKY